MKNSANYFAKIVLDCSLWWFPCLCMFTSISIHSCQRAFCSEFPLKFKIQIKQTFFLTGQEFKHKMLVEQKHSFKLKHPIPRFLVRIEMFTYIVQSGRSCCFTLWLYKCL